MAAVSLILYLLSVSVATVSFPVYARSANYSAVGVTYSAAAPPPPPPSEFQSQFISILAAPPRLPETIASAVVALGFRSVRILDPTPSLTRALSFTEASVLLSVPNHLVQEMAKSPSSAAEWLRHNVVPFYPRTRVSVISVGDDADAQYLVPAVRNVKLALADLGIDQIDVSTTFSFTTLVTGAFPPSRSVFQPIGEAIIGPLLQLLEAGDSPLLVTVDVYQLHQTHSQIPLGLVLFKNGEHDYYDDPATGIRYRNLFDMAVDAVLNAVAVAGHGGRIRVVVAGTGWPSQGGPNDPHATPANARQYIASLVAHLSSGAGKPFTFIDELVDSAQSTLKWGLLTSELNVKFDVNFSSYTNMAKMPIVDFVPPVRNFTLPPPTSGLSWLLAILLEILDEVISWLIVPIWPHAITVLSIAFFAHAFIDQIVNFQQNWMVNPGDDEDDLWWMVNPGDDEDDL